MIVRGAIAFGDMFINEDASVFVGDGYLKAIDLEKKQRWIGVSIDKSIEDEFPNFFRKENLIQEVNGVEYYHEPSIIRYEAPMIDKCVKPPIYSSPLKYTINWLYNFHVGDENNEHIPADKLLATAQKTLSFNRENDAEINAKYIH